MAAPEVVLSEEQIRKRVAELGVEISAQASGPLHVIAVLDNGFMFMSDLIRHLACPVVCLFIKMETHDLVEDGHERRHILYTPMVDIRGKDVLLVDAVLHTGITLDHLIQQFLAKGAGRVRTAVLIDKPEDRRVDYQPNFWGFQVQGRFLVGYGLGYQETYRNLPYVGDLGAAAKPAPAGSAQA
jgi:hypoxanthine phosphoribosyltransferase